MAHRDAVMERRPLVGRAAELAAARRPIEGATAGRAGALLVTGEAGVGKTALVREVCRQAGDTVEVMWGSCLPLASLAVPFGPLSSAVRRWAVDGKGRPPALLAEPARLADPADFDAWLDQVCRSRPVVLVVDDLQWADQSTLDALMYVLAGPAQRRLTMLGTVRSGELREGDPLWRWLVDVRRFPQVAELPLGRLDRVGTAELLAGLLGCPAHQSLVDDVFARSAGNAYLTTLLVRDVPSDARSLPPDLPSGLREAVVRAWHGLSPAARETTRLVAVAGRPQCADRLAAVAVAIGLAGSVVPSLREAVDAGVLDVGADATYWFVHPLLAEVLVDGLLPEERRARHAAYAAMLEASQGDGQAETVLETVQLADHHHRAGHREPAFRWALRGADVADRAGGAAEMLRLLRRALELWPDLSEPELSRRDLLHWLRVAAERAGRQEEELAAVEDLLVLEDRGTAPLSVAALLVRRTQLRLSTGRAFAALDDVREAVRLSAGSPDSGEHALALAELAHAELWHDEPAGPARAAEAVARARASGSAKALSYALTAHVMSRVGAGEPDGLREAEEAQDAAAQAGDFWAFVHAALWAANSLDGQSSPEVIDSLRRSRERMTALGAPHTYVAWMSSAEASGLLLSGQWPDCLERLRVALGSAPGPMADTMSRLTATLLATWQGRYGEARAHLARADELFAEHSEFLAFEFDAVRAELAVATGDTDTAIAAALSGVEGGGLPPNLCERLLPLAARAAADQVQAVRDHGGDPAAALGRLRDLRSRHPTVLADAGPGSLYGSQVAAMQALYDAEAQRGEGERSAAAAWQRTAERFAGAGLPWDEGYAWWRAAEALLPDRSSRAVAAAALRRAHALAVNLAAPPLRARVEALADAARVSLATTDARSPTDQPALPGLTPREREVLAHVVAGRTYAEIARTLVLSEKTVSVHISNLLRKTGAANRLDLAQLVHRLSAAPPAS